ncbi:cellulose-binding domain-containing protein [Lentzea xinjiangensis]|uniref:cellulose-binding domain-containing protein n=1 Tax=Lentzea xinjiangensis TaxID=402600 RepID=UPI001160B352|nr:cellulose-binding domain-containing protein [Lentzea xinjiangensis]
MRKCLLVVLVSLSGACTAAPPEPVTPGRTTPWTPPTLVNQQARAQGVLHFVRDVVDARTVELADGTTVRIAQLAAPAPCWAEDALSFARTTLVSSAVRVSPVLSGDVHLALEDGTDYALLAVRQGVLRAEGADGGLLPTAEVEAAAADRGLWGPPCDGQAAAPPAAPTSPETTTPPPATTAPRPTTTAPPRPPARTCAVAYRVTGQWPGGFQADVTVRNTDAAPVSGWNVRWTFPGGQAVTEMWNAASRQYGATASAANVHYNAQIPAGGSVRIGFNGSVRGENAVPDAFTLNGRPCSVE